MAAILDFGPLECEEKMAPYFFKLLTSSFKIMSFCFYQKIHEITNEPTLLLLRTLNAVRESFGAHTGVPTSAIRCHFKFNIIIVIGVADF